MPQVLEQAKSIFDLLQDLRQDFHRHPEPSFEEKRTASRVADFLRGLGLQVETFRGIHGLWADFKVVGATETIALRADMDALRMDEISTPAKGSFLSKNKGIAHCCGHDAHMAMLLGAAKLLTEGKVPSRHNVRFLFQHAEEQVPGGAIDLINKGCLDGVSKIFGLHVIPPIPAGLFIIGEGPMMASADDLQIRILGKGGHAAMPHLVRDPIVAGSQVVENLQQLVSRRAGPLRPAVISICSFQGGGGANNVIPDFVEMTGTVRTLDEELRTSLPSWIETSVHGVAQACGCKAELHYNHGYPVLVNEPIATHYAKKTAEDLFGKTAIHPQPFPLLAGEDFAYYGQKIPACYVFLGTGKPGMDAPNHATDFDVFEETLPLGTAWFCGLAGSPSPSK
jgi:amidohydrolase